MKKVLRFLWKLVKWVLLSVILLLILIAVVVKVPAVHDFLLHKGTEYFNEKTGGNLSIESIDLRIPTYVQLSGISLKTPDNEKLADIGNIEVSIGWRYIFKKTIRIDKLVLENADARLINADGSGWNYDFIVAGFSDSTAVPEPVDTTATPWDFSLGYARLGNINFTYFDSETNDSIATALSDVKITMDRVSVSDNAYLVDKISMADSEAFVRIGVRDETPNQPEDTTDSGTDIQLGANEILLENNTIHYEMGAAPDRYLFDIGYLSLLIDEFDIHEQMYRVDKLDLQNSFVHIAMAPSEDGTTDKPIDPFAPIDAELKELNIERLGFKMETYGDPDATLNLNKIHIELADLRVKKDEYSGEIKSLRGVYNKLDDLQNFHTGFALTRQHLSLQSLFLQYGNSKINANLGLDYQNFNDLIESAIFQNASLKISDTNLEPADLRNIGRSLGIADSVLILPQNTIFIDMLAEGNLNKLEVNPFVVSTGNTNLNLLAEATGKDWDSKTYRVEALNLHLEREDIMPYITAFDLDTAMIPLSTDLDLEGVFATLESQVTANILSTYGNIHITGNGGGWKSETMPINAEVRSDSLDIAGFLGLDVPFMADFRLNAEVANALDSNTYANASMLIDTLYYDKYKVRAIDLNATLDSSLYSYQILIKDTFLVMDIGGSGSLQPDLKATLSGDIDGIDFQGLGITKEDMRGQLSIKAEYNQNDKFQSGNAHINHAIFVREKERFELEPIHAEIYISDDSSMTSVKSEFFDLYSVTNRNLEDLSLAIVDALARGNKANTDSTTYWHATFQSYESAVLRELFIPALKSFEPANATIDFEASKATINADINFPKILYGPYAIDSLQIRATGDTKNITGDLQIKHVGLDTLCLDRVHLKTTTTDEGAKIEFLINESRVVEKDSTTTADYYARLDLIADSTSLRHGYSISIVDSLVLNKEVWQVDPENDIHSSSDGIELSKLRISKDDSELTINKLKEENKIHISAVDFGLATVSGMINTSEDLLTGRLYADFDLNSDGSFAGNGRIEDLEVAQANFGLFSWDAASADNKLDVTVSTTGDALDFTAYGNMTPQNENESAVDLTLHLDKFDLEALPKILPSMIYAGKGALTGNIDITGTTAKPELKGAINFDSNEIGIVANGSTYKISNQKINIEPTKIAFNKFSIADSAGQKLVVNGEVTHNNFDDIQADLTIKASNFEIANLKAEANQGYYGKLVADLNIGITGRANSPKITADIDISDETALTYVVPESEYVDSYDEDMIIWTNFDKPDEESILTRQKEQDARRRNVYANTLDLSGAIDIHDKAIFRVLIDSLAGDYLEIQGGGKLGITYDRTGSLNLNGTYKVKDGFYQMTFYNIVKRKFDFQQGSQLTWNGDPMNANIDITALYRTRANVAALMSAQAGSKSNDAYSQKLPFEVVMHISGALLKPDLKFSIRLAKEAKGALGGAVDARLNEIASNESELNKQVFSLLVLGTFISTGSGGDQNIIANQARNSASQILSQQLNALSDQLITGVDLNFDLQSYELGGQGSTDLSIDLAKSFMDDRIIIKVGSTIALEDNQQSAQGSQEVMTNFSLEYKLTPEGTYRLKFFRTNDLEDIVVGRITRTGGGILYQKDFNRLRNILGTKSDLIDTEKLDTDDDDKPNPEDGK